MITKIVRILLTLLIATTIVNCRETQSKTQKNNIDTNKFTVAEPVIKWAQSKSNIFVTFKLSHRHDSPSCSKIRVQKITTFEIAKIIEGIPQIQKHTSAQYQKIAQYQQLIQSQNHKINTTEESKQLMNNQSLNIDQNQITKQNETIKELNSNSSNINIEIQNNISNLMEQFKLHSSVVYEGECFLSRQNFLYQLNLTFSSLLSKILIRKQGLGGTYTLIGTKIKDQIWKEPFINKHRLRIWPQFREKYREDMDIYFEQLQNLQSKKKNTRRKKRPQKTNTLQSSDVDKNSNIEEDQQTKGQL